MTSAFWLRDIVAFALQTGAIIVVGAALAFALRIREPRTAAVYWRVLLVACLLLPFCQTWKVTAPPSFQGLQLSAPPDSPPSTAASVPRGGVGAPQLQTWILLLLAGGLGARGLRVLIGAWTLRRLRRTAVPLVPLPAPMRGAQRRLGVRAGFRLSDRITGPITFGARRPVILLPRAVLGMGPHVQEAIAYHELIHVRRRDWLQEILEEGVRTLLWFHPAVRWLIGRIQLTREQLVDCSVIRLTGSRERYVEALLTVALGDSSMSLTPAPLFLRRRVLKKRVAQILEEATMSTRRLIASISLSAAALVCTAIVGIQAFPLQAQAQSQTQERTGAPVQIVSGGEHLPYGALPEYPPRAIEQRIEGDVVLDLTLDDRGEVADARVLSGPDELRRAALQAVLQWHYSPDAVRSTSTQATLRFQIPSDVNVVYSERGFGFIRSSDGVTENDLSPAQRMERKIEELEKALQSPTTTPDQKAVLERRQLEAEQQLEKIRAERLMEMEGQSKEMMTTEQQHELDRMLADRKAKLAAIDGERRRMIDGTARIAQITTERASRADVRDVVARAGVAIGDPFTEETAKRLQQAAASIDEHFRVDFRPDGRGGIVVTLVAPSIR